MIFRHHENPEHSPAWVAGLYHNQFLIYEQLRHIMSALTDLQAAIATLATNVSDGVAEIETLLAKITNPGTSDADVAAATAQISSIATAIKTEVDKARATAP